MYLQVIDLDPLAQWYICVCGFFFFLPNLVLLELNIN